MTFNSLLEVVLYTVTKTNKIIKRSNKIKIVIKYVRVPHYLHSSPCLKYPKLLSQALHKGP